MQHGGHITKDLLGPRGVPVGGGGGDAGLAFANRLVDTYGASEVWRLTDITTGTTIPAHVSAARNGTFFGWDLQNVSGPIANDPLLAPLSGAGDYGNLYSANGSTGLADIFNGTTGSIMMFVKAQATLWTSGLAHRPFNIAVNDANRVFAVKTATNNELKFWYIAGGTQKTIIISLSSTDWLQIGCSWDKNAGATGEFKAFVNGTQQGDTQTNLGAFAGPLANDKCCVLARSTDPFDSWRGWGAYFAIRAGGVWTPAEFASMYADAGF